MLQYVLLILDNSKKTHYELLIFNQGDINLIYIYIYL